MEALSALHQLLNDEIAGFFISRTFLILWVMCRYFPMLSALVILLMLSCKNKQEMEVFTARDPRLIWQGRTFEDQSGYRFLIGSASSVKFRFYGNECNVWMQNAAPAGEYNYFSWVIDGQHHQRIHIKAEKPTAFEIPIEHKAEYHDVEIYKETEASCGFVVITAIEAKGIGELPQSKNMTIEYIGNSITSGMASDPSIVPCGTGKWYDQNNAYDAYGPIVARALNLDFMITAVSGIGIYRNWNSEYPVMGDVYQSTFLTPHPDDPQWKFNSFTPDIVTINLGTNDFSDGDGITPRLPFDSVQYINKYVEFLQIIYKHYPKTKIILLQTSMAGEHNIEMFAACLISVKQKAETTIEGLKPLHIFSFSHFEGGGCTGHPSVEDHQRMARELEPFIKEILIL